MASVASPKLSPAPSPSSSPVAERRSAERRSHENVEDEVSLPPSLSLPPSSGTHTHEMEGRRKVTVGSLKRSSEEDGISRGGIFCNFVGDVAGNIAQRVFAAYRSMFDGPKQILIGGYATLWQGLNSLTSPFEKPANDGPVTTRLRQAVGFNCLALQEAVAHLAGHLIKVVNPNACVDSEFFNKFQQGLVGGRVFSRNFALMEIRTLNDTGKSNKSFHAWQEGKIFNACAYQGGNRVTNWIAQELGGRVVAVASATAAIIVAVASIALGAIAFTFAVLLSLVKNVSDLVTYSRNGGGEHTGEYCVYNEHGHFYEIDNSDSHMTTGHHFFERITQLVTMFAVDNLAEVGTLVNQVHTLGLGIIRPSLLVSDHITKHNKSMSFALYNE